MLELHTYLRTKIGSARRRRTLLGIFYLCTKDCVTTVTLIYFKILTQQVTTPLPRQYPPLPGFSVAAKAEHRRKDGTLRHRSPPFAHDRQLLSAVPWLGAGASPCSAATVEIELVPVLAYCGASRSLASRFPRSLS